MIIFLKKYLGRSQKEKILDIIADGKIFFEKSEFYSDLKQKSVADEDYNSSLYLYKTLNMKNLGDMSDLYNIQDIVLLCEIIENRFQLMHDNYGFNPRKCNSASSLSGSIERDLSKVIIAFPTTNEIIDVFEPTLTGRFSSVNTHLAFDTEILLPNFNEKTKDDLNKDYNYKACYRLKLDNDERQ